jgi:hypothetical protein
MGAQPLRRAIASLLAPAPPQLLCVCARRLNSMHYGGITCCVVGICLVGLSSMLSGARCAALRCAMMGWDALRCAMVGWDALRCTARASAASLLSTLCLGEAAPRLPNSRHLPCLHLPPPVPPPALAAVTQCQQAHTPINTHTCTPVSPPCRRGQRHPPGVSARAAAGHGPHRGQPVRAGGAGHVRGLFHGEWG